MNKVLRHALTGSALATGMLVAASPAQAACTLTATTLVCGTTNTSNTLFPTNAPNDRGYDVASGATQFQGSVTTGAVVDGFGLGIDDLAAAGAGVNFVNNGLIQVNPGNVATVNGSGALTIWVDSGNLTYSGAGDIANLGPAGSGVWFEHSGTGNIVGNFGGSVTGSTFFTGIYVDHNGNGLVDIDTAAGEVVSAGYTGIWVDTAVANAGLVDVNNRSTISSIAGDTLERGIVVDQFGTGGVTIANSGAIGSATDRLLENGIISRITNAASTAATSVTGTGAIFSVGDGIVATTAGTGPVTVNYTGAINTTAGDGIDADATTGALNVTTGAITAVGGDGVNTTTTTGATTVTIGGNVTASDDGVDANSTSGAVTVNVTGGNITATDNGIEVNGTTGAIGVTVAAGRTVTGVAAIDTIGSTGALTVTNNGTLTGTGAGGNAIITDLAQASVLINNNAGAVINGDLDLSNGVDTVNNRGTLNSFGGSNFYAGNDVLVNFTGGVINLDGVVDFGAGTDSFTNNTGGTINVLANSSLLNLETMANNGRLNLDVFTLTGTAGTAFVNGPGSFIDTNGSAGIIGFASLTNSGTIDLAAGTFTVPAGVFTNTTTGLIIADEGATTITGQTSFVNNGIIDLLDGARNDALTINSAYTGTGRLQVDVSGGTADTLTINGNVTGATSIDVNTIGLGVFVPAGILVVDVTGAFTSTEGAFIMGEESGNPLINYDVERRGQDFFLVTLLDPETAFVPLASTGLIREMWYQSADEVFAHTLAPTAKVGLSVWGNVYGSQRRTGMTNEQFVNGVQYDADNNIEIDRYGFQAGVGYGFGVAEVGLTGGYANAQANGDGEFDADGWNIGLYGRYGGLTGFHAEALFKHDAYDVSFDGLFDGNDVDASSTGVDGSVGYRMAMGVVPSIDFHAGLSHVWSDMDGVSAFGFDYDFDDMTSTRGRLGVRGNFGGLYNPYLGATVYREFSGDGDVTITQGAFSSGLSSSGKGTWARLEGGLAGGASMYGVNVAGWVDFGDTRGAGIRAGFRF